MADAFDLMEQAKWETEGTRRAIIRYQEAAAAADPTTLPSGRRLLRDVVPPLVAAIQAKQAELEADARRQSGQGTPWAWAMLTTSAPKLAVITALTTLRETEGSGQGREAASNIAGEIAGGIRDELEFERWAAAQVKDAKAAREAGNTEHVNLLARLRARHPDLHRNVWARWRRQIDLARSEPWAPGVAIQLGSALLALLVASSGGRFTTEIEALPQGRTQVVVRISEETRELMRDIEVRAEVARPQLMPMIIPPIPWRYTP